MISIQTVRISENYHLDDNGIQISLSYPLAELGHHSIGKSRLSVICNQHPFILIAV
jgi:hypothetical protein